jgi:FOG: PKD repeat
MNFASVAKLVSLDMNLFHDKGLAFLSVLLIILSSTVYAQEDETVAVRPCGADKLLARLRQDPAFVAKEKAMNEAILHRQQAGMSAAPPDVVTLPVVVHIVNEDPSAYTNAQIVQAVQALNEAFRATGAFSGGRTDTRIQFCLAKTAPDGGRTTGIVRTHSYLSDFDYDMEADGLVDLGAWNRRRYINIWLVSNIRSEYMQDFNCGSWTRLKMSGYASQGGNVVVSGLDAQLWAHEMGHYLSLLHTFAAQDCRNNNCLTDGDRVCDTPPERTISGGACGAPQNSCSTDTLSGFARDVPDLPDNFMDYGAGAGCIMGFTQGQAERMHHFIATSMTAMQNSPVCNEPCGSAVTAAFTRDIEYPVIGDVVTCTSTATAGQSQEWLVNGTLAGTGPTLALTVTEKKTYQLELRVTDAASGCHATVTDAMQVDCGVVARFYPDKRRIASKEGIQTDHIVFTNRSRNATAWQWLMSNNQGMAEQVVSTDEQLDYTFKEPGTYKVRLFATNGSCKDTSNPVTIVVDDPTSDGVVHLRRVSCYQQNKVRVEIWFENRGYVTIPKGTPVSFYDNDPRTGKGRVLGKPFLLPNDIPGKCASSVLTTIIETGREGLDSLMAVMNDDGSTMPLTLPNTGLVELTYDNNLEMHNGFAFRAKLDPGEYTLKHGEQVILEPTVVSGDAITSATWEQSPSLDCSNCKSTTFTAFSPQDTVTTVTVRAYTKDGCYSDATAVVRMLGVDDFTVTINSLECSAGDSLRVHFSLCNNYKQGNIPLALPVDFYDRLPDNPVAVKLGGFTTSSFSANACSDYNFNIAKTTTGKVYAVVDREGLFGSGVNNSIHSIAYTQPKLEVYPVDTTVIRKTPFQINYRVTGITPDSVLWNSSAAYILSCNDCHSPEIRMLDSGLVSLQVSNAFGCELQAQAYIRIFPPDMTIELLSAECYDDNKIMAKFRICMGNGYDTIYQQTPVSFYGGEELLTPQFYTPVSTFGECQEFFHIVEMPPDGQLVAVVNKDTSFRETNYSNNRSTLNYEPFTITAIPDLISAPRQTKVTLHTSVGGGAAASYVWAPIERLSCTDCAAPVATPVSPIKYQVIATNEYYCKDSATIQINTFVKTSVVIPNAFSPNGDGKNDYLYVIGGQDIRRVQRLMVFNRYGQKVFEAVNTPANDRQYGWDGTLKGKKAETGAYVYVGAVEFYDGTVQHVKGTIILVP